MPKPQSKSENLGGLDEFLQPQSMVTPGVLGSSVILGGNAFAQFNLVPALWLYLLLSLLFGFTATIKSGTAVQKLIYYFLNSIIIFSFAVGANKLGFEAAQRTIPAPISSAHASEAFEANPRLAAFFQDLFPKSDARFNRAACGSISDANTGLQWVVGPDRNFTWSQARDWVAALNACGKEWSLPAASQLATLFDRRSTAGTGWFQGGKYWPAHMDPIFSGIGGGSWVWANPPPTGGQATVFNFNQGVEVRVSAESFYGSARVFAVRSEN